MNLGRRHSARVDALRGMLVARLKLRGKGAADLGSSRGIPRKRGGRPPSQLWPESIVRGYFTDLRAFMLLARGLVREKLEPELPRLTRLAASERGDQRADAVGDEVDRMMDKIAREFWDKLGVDQLNRAGPLINRANKLAASADDTARQLGRYQKEQLDKQIRSIIGLDLRTLSEPNIQGRITQFTRENVSLIKSVPQAFFDQVESRVIAGVQAGQRPSEIAAEIDERYKVGEQRALTIANDQVGKFYGALQEVRQKHLGIEGYIWRTVGDDRVREEHARKEGERFTWDNPPADTGHPGEDINCRCYAEPDLTDILGGTEPLPPEAKPAEPVPEVPEPPAPVSEPEPEKPTQTFSGPDGERYAKQFPELAQIFGEKLHVRHSTHAAQHLSDMALVPKPIMEKLAPLMNEVRVGKGTVNTLGFPKSHNKNRNPKDILGAYFPGSKNLGLPSTGKLEDALGTAVHELAHAADFLLGGADVHSLSPEFKKIFKQSLLEGKIRNQYVMLVTRIRPEHREHEAFAECFRELLQFGESPTRARFGDAIVESVKGFLKKHGT